MLQDHRNRRVELAVSGGVRSVGIELAGTAVDRVLVDLGERRRAELPDDRLEEAAIAAVLQIAQGCFGECCRSGTTVDRLLEDLALALRADFFGEPSIASASAFFNADSADGAAEDPIG